MCAAKMLKSCSFKDLVNSYLYSGKTNSSDDEQVNKKLHRARSQQNLSKPYHISSIDEEDEEDYDDVFTSRHHLLLSGEYSIANKATKRKIFKNLQITVLTAIWICCALALILKSEKPQEKHLISIPINGTTGYIIPDPIMSDRIAIFLEGGFLPPYYGNLTKNRMRVWVELMKASYRPNNISNLTPMDIIYSKNVSEIWNIPTVSDKLIGSVPEVVHKKIYNLYDVLTNKNDSNYFLKITMMTDVNVSFPVSFSYNAVPINENGIIYAAGLLIFLYALIISEIAHRALAALLVSTMSIATLAVLDQRPTLKEIVSWIDIETIILLFSMMILVSIVAETGIFDYLSVFAFRATGGNVWALINTLCLFTAGVSSILDNVTCVLLMTPVTIRLCEVMKLKPVPVLMCMVMYSNLGGALTPIGDPPNVIIASNRHVLNAGITFTSFTAHMAGGVLLSLLVINLQLRFVFRDIESLMVTGPAQDLKREIAVWHRTAASMNSYNKEEDIVKDSLLKKTSRLIGKLQNGKHGSPFKIEVDEPTKMSLVNIEEQYSIKDRALLLKCAAALTFVVSMFFLQIVPPFNSLGLGWTAYLGALLLLCLSLRREIEPILARVEWSTLLFFAALFVIMEALARLGLIHWVGDQTANIVMSVDKQYRLLVGIFLILWISAFASAFVDNIPLTTMMIRVTIKLAESEELNLPLQPLIYALAFGASLGGNGTIFGASANIVCAGVAERHGYRFPFVGFMKIGMPILFTTGIVASLYLYVVHVLLNWN